MAEKPAEPLRKLNRILNLNGRKVLPDPSIFPIRDSAEAILLPEVAPKLENNFVLVNAGPDAAEPRPAALLARSAKKVPETNAAALPKVRPLMPEAREALPTPTTLSR